MKIIFTSLILINSFFAFSQQPANPFPHHVTYTTGSVKPSNYSQAQLDRQVEDYYDAWKQKYLLNFCGAGTYFVLDNDIGGGTNKKDDCVSEGQGYGMVIVPLMAGYDADAKNVFDGLYKFFKQHPSDIDKRLMAWAETNECASDSAKGPDAATDGDMNIAYGLLLADKQWGSNGAVNYKHEALVILNGIKKSETNHALHTLKLGDWVGHEKKYVNSTRPSDFMYDELRAYAQADDDNSWSDLLDECYSLVETFSTNESAETGFLPDFAINCNTTATAAPANFLEGKHDGDYSYNACRVPWHLANDYLLFGDSRAKKDLDKINDFMLSSAQGDVNKMHSGYMLNGTPLTGSNYQDECFLAPFTLAATESSKYQNWLNSCYDALIENKISNNRGYYNNTLKMLCMIAIAGDYWTPVQTLSLRENTNAVTDNEGILVFPNPCRDRLNIRYNAATAGILNENILNAQGKIIYRNSGSLQKGMNSLNINVKNLAAGIYILLLKEKTAQRNISFIVSK